MLKHRKFLKGPEIILGTLKDRKVRNPERLSQGETTRKSDTICTFSLQCQPLTQTRTTDYLEYQVIYLIDALTCTLLSCAQCSQQLSVCSEVKATNRNTERKPERQLTIFASMHKKVTLNAQKYITSHFR